MEAALKNVADLRDDRMKAEKYMELIENSLGMGNVDAILTLVDHLTSEEVQEDFPDIKYFSDTVMTDHTANPPGSSSHFSQSDGSLCALCSENASQ
jgi:hypothetical protein